MQEHRIIQVHQSLHKHAHMLGAERELVMISALIALLVGVGGMTMISALSAFIFWVIALFFLRRMAKIDPLMSKVFMLHIKQQAFYSSKSSIWRKIEGYKAHH